MPSYFSIMKKVNSLYLFFLFVVCSFVNGIAYATSISERHMTMELNVSVLDAKQEKEIKLGVTLVVPDAPQPWQAVVLPSNCTGQDDYFWKLMVPVLLEKGYAAILLDSFTPRGFKAVCTDKTKMWQEARVADAVAILKVLRLDNRFDAQKIALGGHSNGAITAFMAAYTEANTMLKIDDLGFAAYFGVGTTCDLTFKSGKLWAPILLVSGGKDDYTFPEPCIKEIQRLKTLGGDAELLIIDGANHNMSTSGWIYNPKVQRLPKGIPHMFMLGRDAKGVMQVELEDGTLRTGRQMQEQYGGFMLNKSFGGTVGGSWDKFPVVMDAILGHLKKTGFVPLR